jgi:hypothetical protein
MKLSLFADPGQVLMPRSTEFTFVNLMGQKLYFGLPGMWNPVLISNVVHVSTGVLVVINQCFSFVILYMALSIDPDGLLPSQVPFFSMCAL